MKHLIFTLSLCCSTLFTTAQISIMNNNNVPKVQDKPKESTIAIIPCDSLKPIQIWKNDTIEYKQYIGQKIFLLPESINNHIKNSYYTIIDIDKTKDTAVLKLKDDKSGDTIYYNLNYNSERINVAYYNKLKQTFEGKNMIWYLDDYRSGSSGVISDLNNKIYYVENVGKKFKCTAIKIFLDENSHYCIAATLKNNKAELLLECPKNLEDIEYPYELFKNHQEFIHYIIPKLHQSIDQCILEEDVKTIETDKKYLKEKEYLTQSTTENILSERLKKCINLYGKKNGTLIANFTITLGMTRAMCESAGFRFQSSKTTKLGKTIVLRSTNETAVLVNGVVTKIYEY